MKVLRLDPEQAAMLASWVRMAAYQLDESAQNLEKSAGLQSAAQIQRRQAVRARALADRLTSNAPGSREPRSSSQKP